LRNEIYSKDTQYFLVEMNDVILIPSNTTYDIIGEMKLIMFCSPPFDPKNDMFIG